MDTVHYVKHLRFDLAQQRLRYLTHSVRYIEVVGVNLVVATP
jgi:hypothetical protein